MPLTHLSSRLLPPIHLACIIFNQNNQLEIVRIHISSSPFSVMCVVVVAVADVVAVVIVTPYILHTRARCDSGPCMM